MTKAPRVPDYLGHILKAIERIVRYTEGMDEAAFLGVKSRLVIDPFLE
jgi:uncharacterized protein with HEPN domain